MNIERTILIEELVTELLQSVKYLMDRGIKCIACGEPIWGTLESAAREKGFFDDQIDQFVNDRGTLLAGSTRTTG